MKGYLASSKHIDWENPIVLAQAKVLADGVRTPEGITEKCFLFVRDEIQHSWDYKLNPVTCSASDVLKHGTGYCYAKSHLLAALLRAHKIPASLCYQRLTITDAPPFCLHGLNAVYLAPYGWYGIDLEEITRTFQRSFPRLSSVWRFPLSSTVRRTCRKFGLNLCLLSRMC